MANLDVRYKKTKTFSNVDSIMPVLIKHGEEWIDKCVASDPSKLAIPQIVRINSESDQNLLYAQFISTSGDIIQHFFIGMGAMINRGGDKQEYTHSVTKDRQTYHIGWCKLQARSRAFHENILPRAIKLATHIASNTVPAILLPGDPHEHPPRVIGL